MLRLVPLWILAFVLVSCEKEAEKPGQAPSAVDPAKKDASSNAPSTAGKATDASSAGLPEVKGVVEKAKAEGESALGDLKKATASTAETAGAVPATAKEAAKNLPDLSKVTEPSFTADKLKEILNSLSTENLKDVAAKLTAALNNKEGAVKGLKEQIASLGVTDLGKAGDLKKSLDAAAASLTDLKEKLKLVTDKLKGAEAAK